MPHIWRNIKNSQKGGHRPREEFVAELDQALSDFERRNGVKVDVHLDAVIGFGGNDLAERPANYSHPFPRLEDHHTYLFGLLAVPADLAKGERDFTNLIFLATEIELLTIIKDPPDTFAKLFGTNFLRIYDRHAESGSDLVGPTLARLFKYAVDADEHALNTLGLKTERWVNKLDEISSRDLRRLERDLARLTPELLKVHAEVRAMATTTAEMANIVRDVLDPRMITLNDSYVNQLFVTVPQPSLRSLFARARQTESYRRDIEGELDAALQRCDQLREQAQITATHRVTAYGALILVPNLLFDFFGQAFVDLPMWLQRWGWWLTLGVTVTYWFVQVQILRRRKYL